MTMDRRQIVAGGLTAGIALGMADAASARMSAPPAGPWTADGVVKRGGGQVHWVSVGSGPVLVLMPKLGGWVADWRHVAPMLATRFRVIAIDPPGHGGSVMATPPPRIQTLAESAAMVRAALSEMGIERFSFAGNSLGGCIGTVMAALFPADVARLAVVSSALVPKATPAEIEAMDRSLDKDFGPDGLPVDRSFEQIGAKFGVTREMNDEQNASRAQAGLWIRPSERGVFSAGLTDYLPRIAAPTLLVYGSGPAYSGYRDLALSRLKDGRAVTIAGTGAFVHQQQPEKTAEVLLGFLEGRA